MQIYILRRVVEYWCVNDKEDYPHRWRYKDAVDDDGGFRVCCIDRHCASTSYVKRIDLHANLRPFHGVLYGWPVSVYAFSTTI